MGEHPSRRTAMRERGFANTARGTPTQSPGDAELSRHAAGESMTPVMPYF
jgi:hypothetical protein